MAWIPILKPAETSVLSMIEDAAPFGLLIAITQPVMSSSLTSGWGDVANPTIASWIGVSKPLNSVWSGVTKPTVPSWASVPKPISSIWTIVQKPTT